MVVGKGANDRIVQIPYYVRVNMHPTLLCGCRVPASIYKVTAVLRVMQVVTVQALLKVMI